MKHDLPTAVPSEEEKLAVLEKLATARNPHTSYNPETTHFPTLIATGVAVLCGVVLFNWLFLPSVSRPQTPPGKERPRYVRTQDGASSPQEAIDFVNDFMENSARH